MSAWEHRYIKELEIKELEARVAAMRTFIDKREGEAAVPLDLFQQYENATYTFGHRRCLTTTLNEGETP